MGRSGAIFLTWEFERSEAVAKEELRESRSTRAPETSATASAVAPSSSPLSSTETAPHRQQRSNCNPDQLKCLTT